MNITTLGLKSGQTADIDLGANGEVTLTNVSPEVLKYYIDFLQNGHWTSIFGEKTLLPNSTAIYSTKDLGHELIRIGATGLGNGSVILEVRY